MLTAAAQAYGFEDSSLRYCHVYKSSKHVANILLCSDDFKLKVHQNTCYIQNVLNLESILKGVQDR
jgi:hypothetical protein